MAVRTQHLAGCHVYWLVKFDPRHSLDTELRIYGILRTIAMEFDPKTTTTGAVNYLLGRYADWEPQAWKKPYETSDDMLWSLAAHAGVWGNLGLLDRVCTILGPQTDTDNLEELFVICAEYGHVSVLKYIRYATGFLTEGKLDARCIENAFITAAGAG